MAKNLNEYLKLELKNNHYRYMPEQVKQELIERTPGCHGGSLDERMYWLQNGLSSYPSCKRCGVVLSSRNWYPSASKEQKALGWAQKGYRPFCGKTCAMNSSEKRERTLNTNHTRYGVDHALQSPEIQAKRKLTNMERYGASNPMAWSSERFKAIINELYGVVAVRHIDGVSEKINQTKAVQSADRLKQRVSELEELFDVTLLSDLPVSVQRINDVELQWRHTCGHIYQSNITQRGLRYCPRCSNGSSSAERDLGDWLQTKGIVVQRRTREFGFEIDLYLPEYRIGIEYDGTYWHSAQFVSREKSMKKLELAEQSNIHLITIQEHLWILQQEKVKSRLMSILNLNTRVMARKCTIQYIDSKTATAFLCESHLQGHSKAKINIGLFNNSILLAVMSFDRPRFSKKADWELIRYASKSGVTVQGGAGKLLKEFRKNHHGSIISYADRCWSTGGLYKSLGFKFTHNSAPSYFWVSGQHIFTRYQTQKNKLEKLLNSIGKPFDAGLSESDNMILAKFLQVFDRGNSVWLLE